MRKKLLNYSLETDQLVLLQFSDGQSLRVGFDEVADHLVGADLVKVKKAIKIRKDFFKHNNLPGTLVVMAALGLGVFVAVDYDRFADMVNGSHPVATPSMEPAAAAQAIPTVAPTQMPSILPETAAAPAVEHASGAPGLSRASKSVPAVPAVPAAPPPPALQAPQLPAPAAQAVENVVNKLPHLQ